MKTLTHPNVVNLRHAFYTQGDKPDEIYLNLVMDYVPETVFRILKHYNKLSKLCQFYSLKSMHTNASEQSLTFTQWDSVTEISSLKIFWFNLIHTSSIYVILARLRNFWKAKLMSAIFAPDTIELQNSYLVLPIMVNVLTFGPLDVSSENFFLDNQCFLEIQELINL